MRRYSEILSFSSCCEITVCGLYGQCMMQLASVKWLATHCGIIVDGSKSTVKVHQIKGQNSLDNS